jgi:oligopeptide/dipeptide ABC transporter ATP-binding protein
VKGEPRAPLVEAKEVTKLYYASPGLWAAGGRRKYVRALDRVSLAVFPGETVGLVGESGCGKSTLGRLLIRLETPTAGQIAFDGQDITRLRGGKLRRRRRDMQIIFQDPASSLNPRLKVRTALEEAVRTHRGRVSARQMIAQLGALLEMVRLPVEALGRLPREFSVGERQRISLARALAVEPRFLVADEPVSALDVASRAQLSALLVNLQRELGVAFLLISHDVELVGRLSHRIAVMYLGRIVEIAPTDRLLDAPRHPYTRALLASVLSREPGAFRPPAVVHGDPPSPLEPPKGCHFHPRCPHAEMSCRLIVPLVREVGPGHLSMCHFEFDGDVKLAPRP